MNWLTNITHSKLKLATRFMKAGAFLAVLSAGIGAYLIGERGLDTWKKGGDFGYHAAAVVTMLVGGGLIAGSIMSTKAIIHLRTLR
jgi:hypothetical protein